MTLIQEMGASQPQVPRGKATQSVNGYRHTQVRTKSMLIICDHEAVTAPELFYRGFNKKYQYLVVTI